MKIFVCIPTLARASLFTSLMSIEAQTDKTNIEIVIINDSNSELNLEASIPIHILQGSKTGLAGPTRNIGIQFCREQNADWILMLDDDDTLHSKTIEHLKTYKDVDCVIFRAAGHTDHLPFMFPIPPPQTKVLQCGLVTNSFALYKTTNILYDHVSQAAEDFRLLKALQGKILISKYVGFGTRVCLPFADIQVDDADYTIP
jgi:glycosyltransferase involved in cell wall biosynthesis